MLLQLGKESESRPPVTPTEKHGDCRLPLPNPCTVCTNTPCCQETLLTRRQPEGLAHCACTHVLTRTLTDPHAPWWPHSLPYRRG